MFLPAMCFPPSVGGKNKWKVGVSESPVLINHRVVGKPPQNCLAACPPHLTLCLSLSRQLLSGAESLQLVADLLKSIDRISEVSEDGQ